MADNIIVNVEVEEEACDIVISIDKTCAKVQDEDWS